MSLFGIYDCVLCFFFTKEGMVVLVLKLYSQDNADTILITWYISC